MDRIRDLASDAREWLGDVRGFISDKADNIIDRAQGKLFSLASGVNKTLANMLPTVTACLATLSYRGSQGSFSSASHYLSLTASFLEMAQPAPEKFGSPCCKYLAVGNLHGFCLTQNAMFEISGTVDEEKIIEDLFNSGVILDWTGEDI